MGIENMPNTIKNSKEEELTLDDSKQERKMFSTEELKSAVRLPKKIKELEKKLNELNAPKIKPGYEETKKLLIDVSEIKKTINTFDGLAETGSLESIMTKEEWEEAKEKINKMADKITNAFAQANDERIKRYDKEI